MEQGRERGTPGTGPDGAETTAPRPAHRPAGRLRRGLLAALVAAAVAVPLAGATGPQAPAPPPAQLAPAAVAGLDATYAAHRANAAEAARTAADHGYRGRAAVERVLAQQQLLYFDGRGAGLVTEVLGDLAHADRVAVLVPGSDTGIDTYDRFRVTALALRQRLNREAPTGVRTAVVAWLGYETPGTVSPSVATTGRAEEAAPELRAFVEDLRSVAAPRARVSLLCHSYGSVVCARAAAGIDVDDLVFLGSPGTGADTAAGLRTRARVWAARGAGDWVEHVPHLDAALFGTTAGFGTDPVSEEYGARVFAAGDGGHSDYFTPGSLSLATLTRIVLGHTQEVTR
ncbi:alpha/beta fold hydrolase [Streptomyces griseoincarnatus]